MKKYDFTVIGMVCSVQLLKVHSFPIAGRSETVLNTDCCENNFGGCSYNIFAGLAKLGARIYPAISSNSPSCTEELYRQCREYGFPLDGLCRHDDDNWYHCIMLQDDNGSHQTLSLFCGKNAVVGESPGMQELKDAFFTDSEYVLIAVGDERYREIIEKAEKYGAKIVYSYRNDPVLAPLEMLRALLPAASFLFTNEVEAEYLVKALELQHITDLFISGKAEVIVTTLGKDGCIVYERCDQGGYRTLRIGITQSGLQKADTVGAGDGFVSGFMTGWVRQQPAEVCAQWGSTVSSFVIEKEGAVSNLPTFEQMYERNQTRSDAQK